MTSPAPASGADGKVLALLGAGPGLGAALGRRFGREGYRVALVARRPGPLEAVAAGLRAAGVEAAAFPADLAQANQIPEVVGQIGDRFGRIDAVGYAPITSNTVFLPATALSGTVALSLPLARRVPSRCLAVQMGAVTGNYQPFTGLPADAPGPLVQYTEARPGHERTNRKEAIMTTTVGPTWASVNTDAADSAGLADFWGKVLDRPVSPGKTPGITVVGEPDPGGLQTCRGGPQVDQTSPHDAPSSQV